MDITVTNKDGRKRNLFHVDADALVLALIEIFPENFARYERPPKPEPVPQWRLHSNQYGETMGLAIELGSETIVVGGDPKGLVDRCQRALAGRKAPLPSDDLVAVYATTANASALTPVPRYDGSGR
ncbi:MAG: hypothetical protein LAN64_14250 [Acidobacteriia bacterium]|nr:hypothetical protein [Terriglobia bacterium]